MKYAIMSLAIALISLPAFASNAKFEGSCLVVQISRTGPGQTLANSPVSLNPGDTRTIYKQGNIEFQVTMRDEQGTSPTVHALSLLATYGAPNFLGETIVNYTDAAIASRTVPTVHLNLPDFPAFSCQSN